MCIILLYLFFSYLKIWNLDSFEKLNEFDYSDLIDCIGAFDDKILIAANESIRVRRFFIAIFFSV